MVDDGEKMTSSEKGFGRRGLTRRHLLAASNLSARQTSINSSSFENNLVLCHAYKLGLADGQRAVGTKRGGKRIDEYFDDKRQSPRPSGSRAAGSAGNGPSAAS